MEDADVVINCVDFQDFRLVPDAELTDKLNRVLVRHAKHGVLVTTRLV